ncbi:MAG: FlgB family protein [Jhaorihella sp.]
MFTDLNVISLAHSMAVHAGRRQAVIARNVANADTPGYRARDIAPFSDLVAEGAGSAMAARRPTHLNVQGATGWPGEAAAGADVVDPNGNSVSLEQEMLRAVDTRRQHDRALAIYRSALSILRTGLGRI